MNERSDLIAWVRGELVGPSRTLSDAAIAAFTDRNFNDALAQRRGPLAWQPGANADPQEILYYERETPYRKYGAGLLHPIEEQVDNRPDQLAAQATDTLGADSVGDNPLNHTADEAEENNFGNVPDTEDDAEEFDVTSPDVRHPSTIGISFCVKLSAAGRIVLRLPQGRRFRWQTETSPAFPLNGRYERCTRRWREDNGRQCDAPLWRRQPAVLPDTGIAISRSDLAAGQIIRRSVPMPEGSPVTLRFEVYPRQLRDHDDVWLLTVVLRNVTQIGPQLDPREAVLYQTYFEVTTAGGCIEPYPESQRPFSQLDHDEQSLALLYRESATWGIGHGCAAGWDEDPGQKPQLLYADIMPAVQIPSMTPDINSASGKPVQLFMRELAALPDDSNGAEWQSLADLATEYCNWIQRRRETANDLPPSLQPVATRHLDECETCLKRITTGIDLLKKDERIRTAFRLANLAMLLQQIATKRLSRRPLHWNQAMRLVTPEGEYQSPWNIYQNNEEGHNIGSWRAFQIAFLLMSLEGTANGQSPDREIVDLIWFPTGGGKTEAYLGVMAFYIFHERLRMESDEELLRDGTNVLMRYTLRMLTTQQFQRAASLICAMEFLRRNPKLHGMGNVPGRRFSLGLWIGHDGSPNRTAEATTELNDFRHARIKGNPLVLTECPWCRAEIGRFDGQRPPGITPTQWNSARVRGISEIPHEGPLLHCPDGACAFGEQQWRNWLPVEVIDERIYRNSPSLVIATADKLAIVAYRPDAGSLFGRVEVNGLRYQVHCPPGLIIQDELHLISGPLGTMYALYEGIFERLCSQRDGSQWIKPKLIASTATIRGADDQVKALYARTRTKLFPSPGLQMGDSFFGTYARHADGTLRDGRLYLGIHANDYGSILTTQVRAFSSALFRPFSFATSGRDPWWSLLVFYNSIRELAGAKTLFDSDIRSRLKFMFNRENFPAQVRRNLRIVEELTSRLSQAEIVEMMDRLSTAYSEADNRALDACLASSIIEVGVDIDRLSLMGVVGQPKTTAQYIQVTGRVGRRWWERAGLILMIYNPSKSRDRSHFEQFHSYHRRLYERVEPTSATPFALSAIQRALPGALLAWARQHCTDAVQNHVAYEPVVADGYGLLRERCEVVQSAEGVARSLQELERVRSELERKWRKNPQAWEEFPPRFEGEYLMLWPGQFATCIQRDRGVVVASSMRQVDGSAELNITQGYASDN